MKLGFLTAISAAIILAYGYWHSWSHRSIVVFSESRDPVSSYTFLDRKCAEVLKVHFSRTGEMKIGAGGHTAGRELDLSEARVVRVSKQSGSVTVNDFHWNLEGGDWLTWWIPLPHLFGRPYSTVYVTVGKETKECEAPAPGA